MNRTALTIALCLFAAGCQSAPAAKSHGDLATIAERYSGLHERKHRKQLKAIAGVDPVRVRWCGGFLGGVVRKKGHKPPAGHLKAINWRSFGKPVKQPRRGDIVVMRNHVTIYTRKAKGRICGIGGNQGNMVRESCYPARRVIAIRRAG